MSYAVVVAAGQRVVAHGGFLEDQLAHSSAQLVKLAADSVVVGSFVDLGTFAAAGQPSDLVAAGAIEVVHHTGSYQSNSWTG